MSKNPSGSYDKILFYKWEAEEEETVNTKWAKYMRHLLKYKQLEICGDILIHKVIDKEETPLQNLK